MSLNGAKITFPGGRTYRFVNDRYDENRIYYSRIIENDYGFWGCFCLVWAILFGIILLLIVVATWGRGTSDEFLERFSNDNMQQVLTEVATSEEIQQLLNSAITNSNVSAQISAVIQAYIDSLLDSYTSRIIYGNDDGDHQLQRVQSKACDANAGCQFVDDSCRALSALMRNGTATTAQWMTFALTTNRKCNRMYET